MDDETRPINNVLKSFIETIPLPVFLVDRTLLVRGTNQASRQLSGDPEVLHNALLESLIPDPYVIQLVRESVETGKVQHGVYDRGSANNAWKVTVTPLESTASEVADLYTVVIENLIGQRHLEQMQRDFLANISHELRTPLTSIRLLAETLEDIIDTDPDKAQHFVEKIENEAQYLSEMVAELLELTRIESGQLLLAMEPVVAEQLVHEVRARMLPLAQRHRVRMVTDIQHGENQVIADSKMITRVLVNLIHNAIKFTPSGGTIVIGSTVQADQLMQSFFVRDTGIGMSAEELPRVFERFYKTNRARSKTDHIGPGGGGTGLGLAIARQVVEAHGGRIMAESTVGEGSTFTFTLPVAARIE